MHPFVLICTRDAGKGNPAAVYRIDAPALTSFKLGPGNPGGDPRETLPVLGKEAFGNFDGTFRFAGDLFRLATIDRREVELLSEVSFGHFNLASVELNNFTRL